jgi:FkbM family methyltransferase
MKTIFDIGFEDGKDTAYYLHKGYNVIAVDADPKLVKAGTIRFKNEIESGRLILLNVGISEKTENRLFYVNTHKSEWSSFIEEWGARNDPNYYSISVQCMPLGDLVLKYGTPFYIKLDIEGHDILGLDSLLKLNQKSPEYISIEAVSDLSWMDKMLQLGYTKFKLINQANVNRQSTIDWKFDLGASGKFGEDTPCEWVSSEDLLTIFRFQHDPHNSSPDAWFDVHAK